METGIGIFIGIGVLFLALLVAISVLMMIFKRKLKVKQFNEKFCPMSGKCYLYKHKVTGVILRSRNMDNALLFVTEAEANNIIEEFKSKKK